MEMITCGVFFPLSLPLCASSKPLTPIFQPVLGGMRGRGGKSGTMLGSQRAHTANCCSQTPNNAPEPCSPRETRGSGSTGSTPEQGEQSPATHAVPPSSGMQREAGLPWKQGGWTAHSQREALHGNQGGEAGPRVTGGEERRFNEEGGEGDTEPSWQGGGTLGGCGNPALLLFAKPCLQGGGAGSPRALQGTGKAVCPEAFFILKRSEAPNPRFCPF